MGEGVGESGVGPRGDSGASDPGTGDARGATGRDRYSAVPHQGAGMSRRGFALLAVLWTLTAMTVLTGAAITVGRLGSATTRNRVLLVRAGWAREACVEILQARYDQDAAIRALDS